MFIENVSNFNIKTMCPFINTRSEILSDAWRPREVTVDQLFLKQTEG